MRSRGGQAGWPWRCAKSLQRRGGLWFGWSGETTPGEAPAPELLTAGKITYATIDLNAEDYQDFYIGFANGVLWPLFHYRVGLSNFRRSAYEGYQRVNRIFAEKLAPLLQPDDVIWVHDYHFMPLAAELRALGVRNRIGFFLHIPFPAPELLLTLPVHRKLVGDLCAYDLLGFQTEEDVRALSRYITEEAGGRIDENGVAEVMNGRPRLAAFPIGIDTEAFAQHGGEIGAPARDGAAQRQPRRPRARHRRRPPRLQQGPAPAPGGLPGASGPLARASLAGHLHADRAGVAGRDRAIPGAPARDRGAGRPPQRQILRSSTGRRCAISTNPFRARCWPASTGRARSASSRRCATA